MSESASQQLTMNFIGVSTGSSASLRMFPRWARILRLGDARLVGVDIPLNAPQETYRAAVEQIKQDPLILGALVTSHKLNLVKAAGDLFDDLSSDAALCGEVSCIYKDGEQLLGHATDPEASGQALSHLLGPGYWRQRRADVLCLGAGGAAVALLAHLGTRAMVDDRPRQLLLVDRDPQRLLHMERLLGRLSPAEMAVQLMHSDGAAANDRLLSELPPHSLVINATGMGKDVPGSPLTGKARFPRHGVAWDLNYRGQLDFLQQARRQAAERDLRVADGWNYFLIGWAMVVGYVFGVAIDDHTFAQLAQAAEAVR